MVEAFPSIRPDFPERIKRKFRCGTWWQPPRSKVGSSPQTKQPDSFAIIEMAESAENAAVRNAKVALKLLGGESSAALKQPLIGPRRVPDIAEEQVLVEEHAEIIDGTQSAPPVAFFDG